jgi:hypothetical protein
MAQAGFTPISLYFSTTAAAVPSSGNLANGELAINITDKKLYAKDNTGAVFLLASESGTTGTVSTVSVVSANGLTGSVANATTTPAITLSTSVTGIVYGTGGSLSAVTIGSGVSFAGGTLSATGTGGTVTSVGVSGGTTGLTTSGGPITTSGIITLAGTLAVANGGTGQTSYTDGQLLIGNSTGNTLTKATITAGTGITVTNAGGSITIAAAGSGDNSLLWYFMG